MKKVVRLTEADLTRIVKRVVKESDHKYSWEDAKSWTDQDWQDKGDAWLYRQRLKDEEFVKIPTVREIDIAFQAAATWCSRTTNVYCRDLKEIAKKYPRYEKWFRD